MRLAERAVQLTADPEAWMLDSIAAAYANAGCFDAAIATARSALVGAIRAGVLALGEESGNGSRFMSGAFGIGTEERAELAEKGARRVTLAKMRALDRYAAPYENFVLVPT